MKHRIRKYRHFYRQLLILGIPIMIGQVGMIILGFADNIMVGHHSAEELAAASFVNNLFNLIVIFGLGFTLGLTPVIGNLAGQNRSDEAGATLRASLLLNFLLGLILSVLMTLLYFNLHRLGQPESLLPLIRPYFLIQLSGIVIIMLYNSFKQFSDGIMDTRSPMYILTGGILFNILGNYLLIYGKAGLPELGLTGAGLSTLVSRFFILMAFLILFFCTSRYKRYRHGLIRLSAGKARLQQLKNIGLPIALQMSMESGAFNLSVIMMGWIGPAALAAHQIVGTFTTIGFMLYYGIGSAVAILISNRNEQTDSQKTKDTADAGFHLILLIALTIILLMMILRHRIGLIFTDSPEINALVGLLILPTIAYQLGDGLQIAYANALRGIKDVKPLAVIAFFSYFMICLPAGYLFGFRFHGGAPGIWWGFPLGLTLAGLLYYLRFRNTVSSKKNPSHSAR